MWAEHQQVTKLVKELALRVQQYFFILGIGQPGQLEKTNAFLDDFVRDSTKDGVMATNKEGKILGIRLGKIVGKEDNLDMSMDELMSGEPKTAKAYGDFLLLLRVFAAVGYNVSNAFKDLKCR